MKNSILGIVFILINCTVYSQPTIEVGIKGGINFAKVTELADLEHRIGLQGGIFGGVRFSDRFGVQADILFSQQGGIGKDRTLTMDYLTIPVVMKYYLIDGLNTQIGPQVAFIVHQNLTEEIEEDPAIQNTDFSGVVGVGYDFPFGMRWDIRYHIGLLDVVKETPGKNNVFSLAIGYSFRTSSRKCCY